jgi:tetratricopeptide (TPR) repeat protein
LFLRAEYRMNKADVSGDPRDRNAAIPLYRQAIEQDPGFALAYARLSLAEGAVAWYGGIGQNAQQLFAQARMDAEHALRLEPDLAAAQLALGYNDYWSRYDFDGALKAFAAALTLRPNDPDVLDAQGLVQRRTGRCNAAIASFERAFAQDPRNSALATDLSSAYMCAYRYPDAKRWAQRALTLDPDNVPGREAYAYSILFGSGDITRALAAAEGNAPRLKVGTRVPLLVLQRQYAQAMQVLDSVPENEVSDKFLLYVVARIPQRKAELYRLMGEPERAKPLYARILPELQKQLELRQGTYHLAAVWSLVAEAELGLGRTAQGLDAVAKSLSMKSKDRLGTANLMERNAELYAQAGHPELAVPLLSRALVTPGIGEFYSPVMLWLDPAWDSIRHDPRFRALLKKYAKYKPAVIYSIPPAS